MKMIDDRILTLTAEKEECLNDYIETENEELKSSLAMMNMRISMELEFLNELNKVIIKNK